MVFNNRAISYSISFECSKYRAYLAETVGLWGALHKRLWDVSSKRDDLDEAIRAYARGYYIKNDYYNGINYAFMLDVRASSTAGDDALADRVIARRIRESVLAICDSALRALELSLAE